MRQAYAWCLRALLIAFCPLALFVPSALAGTVTIYTPSASATVAGAVTISASANESTSFHMEIWDNGSKLGDFFTNSVSTTRSLPQGGHITTVLAVSNAGQVLSQSSRTYNVASSTAPSVASSTAPSGVSITSPTAGSTSISAVRIAASANESIPFHLEIWDNGHKLGNFFTNSVNITPALPQGGHITTVLAVSNISGKVLDQSSRSYSVTTNTTTTTNTPTATNTPTTTNTPTGTVEITSPTPGSTSISAVRIAASANESIPFHLEISDNGYKLGNVSASSINGVYVLPTGSHVLTVQAIDNNGSVLSGSSVNYNVAENCSNSATAQCNLDQIAMNNVQNDCNPAPQVAWVANGCGPGIQGVNPVNPQNTIVASKSEGGTIPDQGNLTLNGRSLHVGEVQGSKASNVLFRGQSPTSTGTTIDSHWTMDEYVYLPNPNAHQAFEIDAQYTGGKIWTKFYTECAFNMNNGTGFWAVFDSSTGGWIFLNGKSQNGQTPPVVPCNRSQFSQPWAGSSNPSFSGWHHIAWTFLRDSDGTVTFQTLVFDGTTTQVNFKPNSRSGGSVGDYGNFSALIQLDGVVNPYGQYNVVDAYVSGLNLTHTP